MFPVTFHPLINRQFAPAFLKKEKEKDKRSTYMQQRSRDADKKDIRAELPTAFAYLMFASFQNVQGTSIASQIIQRNQ